MSQLTIDECAAGDTGAANERFDAIRHLDVIVPSDEAERVADLLIRRNAVPSSQPRDALHIAVATENRLEFIATWNFRHILNPLDVLCDCDAIDDEPNSRGKADLKRIVAMLTRLIQRTQTVAEDGIKHEYEYEVQ